MSSILDGRKIAARISQEIKRELSSEVYASDSPPTLAVILVGNHTPSEIYVKRKEKACDEVGIKRRTLRLQSQVPQEQLLKTIETLNRDKDVHGILLQLPLPPHLDKFICLNKIHPGKDVDGLSYVNQGRLLCARPGLIPCTPLGIQKLIEETQVKLMGKLAVTVGRSPLVGKPVSFLMEQKGASVLGLHSKSQNAAELSALGDVLIVATGVKNLVRADWVKPGAIVIDVGIHRDENGSLCGDVLYKEVQEKAAFITPVPGGVGPMTIAMLLQNTLKAYKDFCLSD